MKKFEGFASEPPPEAQEPRGTFLPYSAAPLVPPAPQYATPPAPPQPLQPPQPPLPPAAPYTNAGTPEYGASRTHTVTGTPQYGVPQPPFGYAGGPTIVRTKLPFVPGHPPPVAPPGFVYVYVEQISPVAILLCILLFPWGILFLLCAKERYWLLQAMPAQAPI